MTKNYKVADALEEILANSYFLQLKTQNYHWNVEGPNFKGLHELFEMQYNDIFVANDAIAERARFLGKKIDATYENFSKLNEAKSGNKDFSASEMVKDLVADNELLVKKFNEAIKLAQDSGDEASADILIQRIQAHEKSIWMLKSSI
jgi:starvation-inducible DNA-binding protein